MIILIIIINDNKFYINLNKRYGQRQLVYNWKTRDFSLTIFKINYTYKL